jgi:5-formyltetrahydrofolate cyclo-ligase
MVWHEWQGQGAEEFAIGSYGIEEPQTFWPELRDPDLILVPTVACDRRGFRLGYGGGYYDRMLANLSLKTRTIGIGLEQFLLDQLPIDDWDIPLDAICTESGLFYLAATQ